MAPLACPSMRCTTLRFAPAEIATAVCRRSCAVTRGNVSSASWQRATPGEPAFLAGGTEVAAVRCGSEQVLATLPAAVAANAVVTKAGTTTVRFLIDLRLRTTN